MNLCQNLNLKIQIFNLENFQNKPLCSPRNTSLNFLRGFPKSPDDDIFMDYKKLITYFRVRASILYLGIEILQTSTQDKKLLLTITTALKLVQRHIYACFYEKRIFFCKKIYKFFHRTAPTVPNLT